MNRCLVCHPDESDTQTARINQRHGQWAAHPRSSADELQPILQLHHTLQRLLRPHVVAIPFGPMIAERVSCQSVEMRRALELFFSAIRASALLHQRQREVDRRKFLLADPMDYAIARELLQGWLAEQIAGDVGDGPRKFLTWLKATFRERTFTIADVVRAGKARSTAQYNVAKLVDGGALNNVSERQGSGVRGKFRVLEGDQAGLSVNLPTPEEVANHHHQEGP